MLGACARRGGPPLSETMTPARILSWFMMTALFLLTGAAAVIAADFTTSDKPHVFVHTMLAYGLVWALFAIYGRAYASRRRFLSIQVWLVVVAFLSLICFVHLDDAPARPAFRGGVITLRPEAPQLYWAAALDVASAVVLTIHALWLRRLLSRVESVRQQVEAAAADSTQA